MNEGQADFNPYENLEQWIKNNRSLREALRENLMPENSLTSVQGRIAGNLLDRVQGVLSEDWVRNQLRIAKQQLRESEPKIIAEDRAVRSAINEAARTLLRLKNEKRTASINDPISPEALVQLRDTYASFKAQSGTIDARQRTRGRNGATFLGNSSTPGRTY